MKKILALSTLVLAVLALAAVAAEDPAPAPIEPDAGSAIELLTEAETPDAGICVDEPTADALADGIEAKPAAPGGCKACKGRTWCTCSYQGKPRISCNPCCYQGPLDPFPICFD